MLKGLRTKYLQETDKAFGKVTEADIVHAVFNKFSQIDSEAMTWRNLWQTILRFFYPGLNNVQIDYTGGDIRFNEIFASEPTTYLTEVNDFIYRAMFPEGYPWFGIGVFDHYGRRVPKGKLSTNFLRHLQDAEDVLRDMMLQGNFYPECRTALLHFLLLGNAILRVAPWGKEAGAVRVADCPVHRIGVQRDSMGKVYCLAWAESLDRWQIYRDYGAEGWNLFRKTGGAANPDNYLNQVTREIFGATGGGVTSGYGTTGTFMPLGTAQSGVKRDVEDTIRLMIPNDRMTGVPNPGTVFPELGYVCYVITRQTKRLLDVEMYSDLPFGVASDLRVTGEAYGRGMCGRVLPDVGVLNKKKQIELIADSVTAQSPVVIAGQGLSRPIGKKLLPFQQIHAKSNTSVAPLFDVDALMRRTKAIYEDEKLSVAEGMRRDKINLEMSDRMTLGEFSQRRDISQSIFQPQAGVIYTELIHPILKSALNYAYMVGKLPPPPPELLLSGLRFKIETYSMFSYGQNLEKGMNFSRAMAPLGEFPKFQPEILDNIDFNALLRANLANYGLADILLGEAQVESLRDRRAQTMAQQRGGGGSQMTGAQKGRQKAEAEAVYRETAAAGIDDTTIGGLG